MIHQIIYQSQNIRLERYPKTNNKSLLPYSNAEILALDYVKRIEVSKIHLFNDRFGVWNCALHDKEIVTIWNYASQLKAINNNLKLNEINDNSDYKTTIETLGNVEVALIKIPKSLELFELYLNQIQKGANENTTVVCCFMTKYFNSTLLKIANNYFDDVSQSKAWKKTRLLILKSPKKLVVNKELLNTIDWKYSIQQYFGVFSAQKIDVGTQFLLEDLEIKHDELNVLDVASGNGVIALEALKANAKCKVTVVDDSQLAIASSQLNLPNDRTTFVCDDHLKTLKDSSFDLVLSNPPFHFEYENNIDVSLNLFKEVSGLLKPNGRFVLVANKHLNYSTHLIHIFREVNLVKANTKFEVLECKV